MKKIAIIGCGKIARDFHLPILKSTDNVKISAIFDINQKTLSQFAKNVRDTQIFNDYSLLLESDIDAVDICTPGYTHYDLCMQAIKKGKHVLVEKPLCLSVADAKDIERSALQEGVKICVIHNYRFHEPIIKAKLAYDQGKLGEIRKVFSVHHQRNVWNELEWMWDEKKTGGILYELGIHSLDLQTVFCGEPKQIIGLNTHYSEAGDYVTSIEAIVKYENERIGIIDITQDTSLHSSNFTELRIYASGCDAIIKFFPSSIRFSSTNQLDPLEEFSSEFRRLSKFGLLLLSGRYKRYSLSPHKRVINGFFESIEKDEKPPVTIKNILPTMKLLEMLKKQINKSNRKNSY